ncbi:hypothetical protein DFH09DRAFT_1075272 [Mycena vulgaris]|nr:hypothetical protein DFH09DRAFT_1075272 [Mycena vulgaris]
MTVYPTIFNHLLDGENGVAGERRGSAWWWSSLALSFSLSTLSPSSSRPDFCNSLWSEFRIVQWRAIRILLSTLYSDEYAIAVAVVGQSVRSANVSARLFPPYLEAHVPEKALCITRAVGWEQYTVPLIPPPYVRRRRDPPPFQGPGQQAEYLEIERHGHRECGLARRRHLVRQNFGGLFDSPFNFAAVPDAYLLTDRRPRSLKMEIAEYPLGQAEQVFLNLYFGGTPPFLHEIESSSDTILSPQEVEQAMDENERRENGTFCGGGLVARGVSQDDFGTGE